MIRELDTDPERLDQVRQANVASALTRHDWVYRWETVLGSVGMPPSPRVASRKAHLAALGDEAAMSGRAAERPAALPSPRVETGRVVEYARPLAQMEG